MTVELQPAGSHGSDTLRPPTEATSSLTDSEFPLDALFGQVAHEAAAHAAAHDAATIGRYTIVRELGHGSMGVVYLAHDAQLDRRAAIKLLRAQRLGSDPSLGHARLLREAQALAKMSHPNVVTVYETGVHEGEVYLAMEYIDGLTLRDELASSRRTPEQILALFMAAARGLIAAHDCGLIHRDFKPDNVMLGSDGRVCVMDFGLARAVQPAALAAARAESERNASGLALVDPELTATGALLGSPAYMAPEQYLSQPIDERSDQFSFCVALWEALYGQRPFVGHTLGAVARQIVSGELTPPPVEAKLPAWIRVVLERGLAVDPQQRWPSMRALVDALEQPPRRRRRRRNLVMGTLVGVGLAGLSVFGLVESQSRQQLESAHELELARRRAIESTTLLAEGRSVAALRVAIEAAAAIADQPDVPSALEQQVSDALFEANAAPLRWGAVDELRLSGWTDVLASSPDGRLLAVSQWERFWTNELLWGEDAELFDALARGPEVWSPADGPSIRVHELATGRVVGLRGHDCHVDAIVFADDGSRLSAGCDTGELMVWDAHTGALLLSLDADAAAVPSPDGRFVASIDARELVLWSTASGQPLARLTGHDARPRVFAFAFDSSLLASSDGGRDVHVWDVARGTALTRVAHPNARALSFHSNDAMTLSSVGPDQQLRSFDLRTGALLDVLTPPPNRHDHFDAAAVHELAVTPRGDRLALYVDRHVWLWDRGSGELLLDHVDWSASPLDNDNPFALTPSKPDPLQFSPDGTRLLMRLHNGGARLFDTDDGRVLTDLGLCAACSFSPDADTIVLAGGSLSLWSARTGTLELRLDGRSSYSASFVLNTDLLASAEAERVRLRRARSTQSQNVRVELTANPEAGFAFSSDGARVATVDGDAVQIWNASTGAAQARLLGHRGRVHAIATAPASPAAELLSAGADGSVRVWDLDSGRTLERFDTGGQAALRLALSSDASVIASATTTPSGGGAVHVWNRHADEHTGLTLAHPSPSPIVALAVTPDGRRIVTASATELRCYDAHTGELMREWTAHEAPVRALELSPDGALIGSRGPGKHIRIWDTDTGALELELEDDGNGPHFAFSPDGARLASASRIWRLQGGEVLVSRITVDHGAPVRFAPNGRLIAIGDELWDPQADAVVLEHPSSAGMMLFSPDGTRVAGLGRRELIVYDATSPLRAACRRFAPLLDYREVEPICAPLLEPDAP